jgi:flagellar assembly factor FliW
LDEDSPYRYLKSVNERDWYFLVIDPLWFLSEYEVKMDENERQAIDLVSDDDLQLLSLVAIPEEIELVSVNLRMPICLNRYNLRAYHKLLPEQFPVKFYIFYELNDLKKRLSQKI